MRNTYTIFYYVSASLTTCEKMHESSCNSDRKCTNLAVTQIENARSLDVIHIENARSLVVTQKENTRSLAVNQI